ncbi:MAG: M28 family peptidase [Chloroflexi bacterium]|nr:M28 family peptidase [Chloroflexota bacterium]
MHKLQFAVTKLFIFFSIFLSLVGCSQFRAQDTSFDGQRAYANVEFQVSLGPRPIGSEAHAETIQWIVSELQRNDWNVEIQRINILGHDVQNIIARNDGGGDWIILGAHYDTRMISDQDADPEMRSLPVLGANDGASGVGVLLELARVLPEDLDNKIWLVFFDAEDNGGITDWDWILGSRAFVENLEGIPDAVVILDMIGDENLEIYFERNSDVSLAAEIWAEAEDLGYVTNFIPEYKYSILDDHTPFLQAGIKAVDIIDFDYPYWHTSEDTFDKISSESLQIVGETILAWLLFKEE